MVEDVLGGILIKKSIGQVELSDTYERNVKLYFLIILLVNFNLITWFFPSKESYMFVFYFIVLMAFFLDLKFISYCAIGEVISLIILFVGNTVTRPEKTLFITDAILRLICISLILMGLIALVYFVNRFLLNAKKDEIEKNNERVQNVLNNVTHIAGELGSASSSLVSSSQTESASTERSVSAIEQADAIMEQQNKVIQETVSINEDNASGIRNENEEFFNIANMVQSNTEEIITISQQVDTINGMITELEALLEI